MKYRELDDIGFKQKRIAHVMFKEWVKKTNNATYDMVMY